MEQRRGCGQYRTEVSCGGRHSQAVTDTHGYVTDGGEALVDADDLLGVLDVGPSAAAEQDNLFAGGVDLLVPVLLADNEDHGFGLGESLGTGEAFEAGQEHLEAHYAPGQAFFASAFVVGTEMKPPGGIKALKVLVDVLPLVEDVIVGLHPFCLLVYLGQRGEVALDGDILDAGRGVAAVHGGPQVGDVVQMITEQACSDQVDGDGIGSHKNEPQLARVGKAFVAHADVDGVHGDEVGIAGAKQIDDLLVEHEVVMDGALVVRADAYVELHRSGHVGYAVALELGQVDLGVGPCHLARNAQDAVDRASDKNRLTTRLVHAEDPDRAAGFLSNPSDLIVVA